MQRKVRVLVLVLSCMIFIFMGFSCKNKSSQIIESIGKAYGYEAFKNIGEVKFTFNVLRPDGKEFHRHWTWNKIQDTVSFEGDDSDGKQLQHQYNRANMNQGDQALNIKVDKWFINDKYWLFFPIYLSIDKAYIKVTEQGIQDLPISQGKAKKLLVEYPKEGGYTPGDAYEYYLGEDYFVKEWAYHKSGVKDPTLIATWENYTKFGPITLSLLHNSKDGKFKLWFTDVSIQYMDHDKSAK